MNLLGGRYYESNELKEMGFAHVGKNVKIHDRACIFFPENIYLDDNVRIDALAVIIGTGKLKIGSYVHIPNFCYLSSKYGITINDFCSLGPGVRIFSVSDDYSGQYLTGPMVPKELTPPAGEQPVIFEKHIVVGANSVILPGCIIGEGCSIGALSLVKSNLEPWGIYAGIPATLKGKRSKNLLVLEKNIKLMNE